MIIYCEKCGSKAVKMYDVTPQVKVEEERVSIAEYPGKNAGFTHAIYRPTVTEIMCTDCGNCRRVTDGAMITTASMPMGTMDFNVNNGAEGLTYPKL